MTREEWERYLANAKAEGSQWPERQWSILMDLIGRIGERTQWDMDEEARKFAERIVSGSYTADDLIPKPTKKP